MLCEEARKAIAVFDRMITQEPLSIEFEQGLCKIEKLSAMCVATTVGDALEPRDIFRDAKNKISQLTSPSMRQITSVVRDEFIECRKRNVEDQLLKPRGFKSLEDFYSKMRDLPPDIYGIIDNNIERFHLLHNERMAIMLAGIDYCGSHIYLVYDPGRYACFDSIGFHAIGSGTPHAISVLTSYGYTHRAPLNKALWIAYEAKRRAERAPGVGKGTDMCIVDEEKGVTFVSEDTLQTLNSLYEDKDKKEKEWLDKLPNILQQDKESKD
jgi:hypothetical protein